MSTETKSVIPERLNASDFTLYNATPEMVAQFQLTLDDTQNGHDPVGTTIIKAGWLAGGRVVLNPFTTPDAAVLAKMSPEMQKQITENPGRDFYDPETHAVYWNPYSALEITDRAGNVIGVQSPRLGYVHEAAHSIDEQLMTNIESRVPLWHNSAEYLATSYETMSSIATGEPTRDGYHGGNTVVYVENSTMHTGVDMFGQPVWLQINALGVTETGPAYGFQKILPIWFNEAIPPDPGKAPVFGSTIPITHQSGDNAFYDDTGYHIGETPTAVSYTDQGIIAYDGHGNPYVFTNPPLPDINDAVLLDPSPDNSNTGPWENYRPNSTGSGSGDLAGGTTDGGASGSGTGCGNMADWVWGDTGGAGTCGNTGNGYGSGSSVGGDYGCVAVASFLPDGRRAGDIEVGDSMELADQHTLEQSSGVVSYSQEKFALGYRITTESGATLVCSDTAPIPVRSRGLMTPGELLGEEVAVRHDENGIVAARWEKVTAAEVIGHIAVQHITVGDKCFWAGETKGAYILHHNRKATNDDGSDGQRTAHSTNAPAELIGVQHVDAGIM